MSIEIIDILKPKNGLSFKLIEDIDIAVQGYTSLADAVSHFVTTESIQQIINAALSGKQDKLTTAQLAACNSGITSELVAQISLNTTAIAGKADAADLTALEAEVDTKADSSDLTTATASLQAQIDNIVSGSTADSEVINARVGEDGTSYNTLKARLDAEAEKSETRDEDTNAFIDSYINGAADTTVTVVANTTVSKKYNFIKGRSYVYKNNTAGAVNLKVYSADGTAITTIDSIGAGNEQSFTCNDNGVRLTSYAANDGTCTLVSVNDGERSEDTYLKNHTVYVDFDGIIKKKNPAFTITRITNGIKCTTKSGISGNTAVYLRIPIASLSIKSIEFDIESSNGSPNIFIGKDGGVTHISSIISKANSTFDKRHIIYDIPDTNLADGDTATLNIWVASGANANGWFNLSNLEYKRNTLSTDVSNLANTVSNLNANDVSIENELLTDMNGCVKWNYGTISIANNQLNFTPVNGQNSGIQSAEITHSTKNFLGFEFEIATTYHSNLVVYLFGKDTNNSSLYLTIKSGVKDAGKYRYTIDLNHYVVYQNLDLTKPVRCALVAGSSNNAEVLVLNYFNVYDLVCDLDVTGSVADGFNYINSAVNSLENRIDTMTVDTKLYDENGNPYLLQISNGQIVVVPALASKILYVGNSLLLGFETFGMAASNSQEDYYYYVNDYLADKGVTVDATKLVGSGWENATSYAAQNTWLQNTLLPQLNNQLQLVIVQLGDNVNTEEKQAVFAQGTINMMRFIRQNAPNARVAWVGAWYTTSTKQRQMADACKACGATFIDISKLYSVEGNQSYVGAVWTDDNGNEHTIDSTGVASHPSSQGMRAVADKIIEALF